MSGFRNFSIKALVCIAFGLIATVLAGCASVSDQPKPAELGPNSALIGVRLAWSSKIGAVEYPLDAKVSGTTVTVAGSDGTIAAIDTRTGGDIWRVATGARLAAGVGSDGRYASVVTRENDLILLDMGRELWRTRLPVASLTAPLVAGGRLFVLAIDRSVMALDIQTGRKLWSQTRPGEPLVLRQAGVILAVGDTLVVGVGGRLVGMSPQSGTSRWEVPIAIPRGTNDVERLVDLVAHASRVSDSVCVRSFQATVGCVNTSRGVASWSKPSLGSVGLSGDDSLLFGTESDGRVVAWRRENGDRVWLTERLRYRSLSEPLAVGRSVVIGDETGTVHLLSREDGSPLTRFATDGTAINSAPVLAGDTLIVITRSGGVFGFKPE